MAARELAPPLRRKVRVVVQSSATDAAPPRRYGGSFSVCVIGHLRAEKDPLRTLAALAYLPDEDIEVVHLGAPLDEVLAREARTGMAREPRYRWLGSVPHARALRWLASSHAMVISSRMEGGANVVCEALRIGVPVLASRIPGNVGLLGSGYAGLLPAGGRARPCAAHPPCRCGSPLLPESKNSHKETTCCGRASRRGARPALRAIRCSSLERTASASP